MDGSVESKTQKCAKAPGFRADCWRFADECKEDPNAFRALLVLEHNIEKEGRLRTFC